MRLNQPKQQTVPPPHLSIDGQQIAVVDDFKYLGAYKASIQKDVLFRIGQTWGAFAKIRPILLSPKPSISFKMRLFNAACISILLYGCESWVLTPTFIKTLDILAQKRYHFILSSRWDAKLKNVDLYKIVGMEPISEQIRRRQLKFIGHCLRMPDTEPVHTYAIYVSHFATQRVGRPSTTYLKQTILNLVLVPLDDDKRNAKAVTVRAINKPEWNKNFAVSKKKKPPDILP